MIKIRKWLIRMIAGKMGVVLNAELGIDDRGKPFIT